MRFSFEFGDAERHVVDFTWGAMLGTLRIKIDGVVVARRGIQLESPTNYNGRLDPGAQHFDWGPLKIGLVQTWTFQVGDQEKHLVRIEQERPMYLAGARPKAYRVFVDNQLSMERSGY